MSFDIRIATREPPTRAMVEAFVKDTGWRISLEGDLAGDAGNLVGATNPWLGRSKPIFVLSGPFPAERDDLPARVGPAVRGPAFLSEMNLPWPVAGSKEAARCFDLCEHLARACDGAVYDPQDDAIVFSARAEDRRRAAPRLTAVRQLSLEWFFARSDGGAARRFLDVVGEVWTEALPTRFGPHEPLGHKMNEPGSEAAFAELWRADWMFFWKARQPVFGGSLGRSPEIDEPPGRRRKVTLRIDVNATAVADDPATAERVVELFARVAEELGAFFGAGFVTRGVLAGSRGAVWYGRETENFSFDWIDGPWWMGLPSKATWLTWFGAGYRDAVASAVRGAAEEHPGGLLLRLGPEPMDSDQVRGSAPTLPPELVVGMTPRLGEVPMADTGQPIVLAHDRSPARVIPPLV
jgi:hypothetical protein